MPYRDCLTYGILQRLIEESRWQCIFLMRLLLLFLKQLQKLATVTPDEIAKIGVDTVDQILSKKPWLQHQSDKVVDEQVGAYWPNLMRGLCFFAAEYAGKSAQVRETFRKHLLGDSEDD